MPIHPESQPNQFKHDPFRQLQLRLMVSYFGVISAILTVFLIAVHQSVAYKLNQRLTDHLVNLASASAQSLDIIEHEYRRIQRKKECEERGGRWSKGPGKSLELLLLEAPRKSPRKGKCRGLNKEQGEDKEQERDKNQEKNNSDKNQNDVATQFQDSDVISNSKNTNNILPDNAQDNTQKLDIEAQQGPTPPQSLTTPTEDNWLEESDDGEMGLTISLEELMASYKKDKNTTQEITFTGKFRSTLQKIEWFDENRKLLAQEGQLEIQQTLPETIPFEGLKLTEADQLSFVLPVYLSKNKTKPHLIGYVRATASKQSLAKDLRDLRLALALGFLLALAMTIVCGNWLTAQSLRPLAQNVSHLQQFTSDAAHELRTPLTIIQGAIHILNQEAENLSSGSLEKLDLVSDASQQMNRLVNDLLLLARLDTWDTKIANDWRQIPIDEILDDLLNELEIPAQEKNIDLRYEPFEEVKMTGNADQIKSLLSNLLSNALRYTDAGGSVTVSLRKNSSWVVVEVADTGIGIEPNDVSKVFNRFWQADQARTYAQEGSGLGLAIAQAIARQHRGQISLVSQIGKGSTFTVQLPL